MVVPTLEIARDRCQKTIRFGHRTARTEPAKNTYYWRWRRRRRTFPPTKLNFFPLCVPVPVSLHEDSLSDRGFCAGRAIDGRGSIEDVVHDDDEEDDNEEQKRFSGGKSSFVYERRRRMEKRWLRVCNH